MVRPEAVVVKTRSGGCLARPALGMFEVRPNRAADVRGPPFWTLKIPYELTCQLERFDV